MFNLSYTSPCEFKGEIRYQGPLPMLGPFTDLDGKRWHIRGIFGDWVQACPESDVHPYYTDTSGMSFGFHTQTWEPYRLVKVEKEESHFDRLDYPKDPTEAKQL